MRLVAHDKDRPRKTQLTQGDSGRAACSPDANMILQMGGREIAPTDHQVTETAVRGMWRYWRKVMGL